MFQPPPDLTLPLDGEPTAPGKARACIRTLLGDRVPADFSDDAQLLTSELVTNAVLYAPDGCRLSAWFAGLSRGLRVEVTDASFERPAVQAHTPPSQLTGRGLQLVASRSTDWGVTAEASGKSVWFELRR